MARPLHRSDRSVSVQLLLTVWHALLQVLIQVLPITFAALFGAELLVRLGAMKKLAPLGVPLTKLSRLPSESTITFITGIGSITAANSMLAAFRNDGTIDDRELILSSLLNSIPMYIRESITYHLPIVFPLLGLRVGTIYFVTFWVAGLLKLLFIILGGRMMLGKERQQKGEETPGIADPDSGEKQKPNPGFKRLLGDVFRAQMGLFLRIVSYYSIVTFVVLLCMELGLFKWTDALIAPMTGRFGLPSAVVGPLSAYVVSPMAGLTSMAALLQNGQVTEHQAIVALMVGGLIMIPVIYLRCMLPNYVVIFGARLGTPIVLLSMGFAFLARLIILGAVTCF